MNTYIENVKEFESCGKLLLLLELEKVSPGYINKEFIQPIANNNEEKKSILINILEKNIGYEDEAYKILVEILKNNSSKKLFELIKENTFLKKFNERLSTEPFLINLYDNSIEEETKKVLEEIMHPKSIRYGFNKDKNMVQKAIEAKINIEKKVYYKGFEIMQNLIESYGIKVVKEFSIHEINQIYNYLKKEVGLDNAKLIVSPIINEKISSIVSEDESAKKDLYCTNSYYDYNDISSLKFFFKEFDNKNKDIPTLSNWISVALILDNEDLFELIEKEYPNKRFDQNVFSALTFNALTTSTSFSKAKKILYRKNTDMEKDMLLPIIEGDDKSLSKGLAILLAIKKNKNSVEHLTKKKIEDWSKTISERYGIEILRDCLERDVFSDKTNILKLRSIDSLSSFLVTINKNVFNVKLLSQKININDKMLLGLLNLSFASGDECNYDKDFYIKEHRSPFIFKNPFDIVKDILSDDFLYENKHNVIDEFVESLIKKDSKTYLNIVLQGITLNLFPTKFKNVVIEKYNIDSKFDNSINDSLAITKFMKITPVESHKFVGLTNLWFTKNEADILECYINEVSMKKDLDALNKVSKKNSTTVKKF